MYVTSDNICRLCLNMATIKEFAEIDVIRQMFDILLLKLDLNITRDPIICWDCVEIAKKCLKFKKTCLAAEQIILSFSTNKTNAKHNIKVIYKEREKIETALDDDLSICRICMTRLEKNKFASSLDTLGNELTLFEMLAGYISEMDVNIIEDPIICTTCTEKVNDYLNFVGNCLDTEEKITAYCKETGNRNIGQINLANVLRFLVKGSFKGPEKYSQICAIKEEAYMLEDTKCRYPYNGLIKFEEFYIKKEFNSHENYYKLPEVVVDKSTRSDAPSKTRESITGKCTNQEKIQANVMEDGSIQEDTLKQDKSESSDLQINKYSLVTDVKKNIRDFITDTASSDADINKYRCTAEEKQRNVLKNYIKLHEGASECKEKNNVNSNKIHKCSLCSYETEQKASLKSHRLIDHNISRMKIEKCSLCAYEVRGKVSLRKHMLVHKDVSEIDVQKCSMCMYAAKDKRSLKMHMLVHKDVSEMDMHKCSMCTFETKHKGNLRKHMLVHKEVSDIKMHKCSLCTFKTKHKNYLKFHSFKHQDISEIEMYKCFLCDFAAKYKSSLKVHMLVHKDVSGIDMHKCSICPFKTKYKFTIKDHMLVHKDISEIDMQKCSMCAYETKLKSSLRKHMFVHKRQL